MPEHHKCCNISKKSENIQHMLAICLRRPSTGIYPQLLRRPSVGIYPRLLHGLLPALTCAEPETARPAGISVF